MVDYVSVTVKATGKGSLCDNRENLQYAVFTHKNISPTVIGNPSPTFQISTASFDFVHLCFENILKQMHTMQVSKFGTLTKLGYLPKW